MVVCNHFISYEHPKNKNKLSTEMKDINEPQYFISIFITMNKKEPFT